MRGMMRREQLDHDRAVEQGTLFPLLPFVVRRMRESDIPAVVGIERRSFPSPWPESAYRYELRFGVDSLFFVLRHRDQEQQQAAPSWRERLKGALRRTEQPLLGYTGLRFRSDDAHISTIAVHPDWRGRGLGELLLLTAIDHAIKYGAQQVTLEVRTSNLVAQHLYTKVGFVGTGMRYAYYRDGEDAWLMTLWPLNGMYRDRLSGMVRALEKRLQEEQRR